VCFLLAKCLSRTNDGKSTRRKQRVEKHKEQTKGEKQFILPWLRDWKVLNDFFLKKEKKRKEKVDHYKLHFWHCFVLPPKIMNLFKTLKSLVKEGKINKIDSLIIEKLWHSYPGWSHNEPEMNKILGIIFWPTPSFKPNCIWLKWFHSLDLSSFNLENVAYWGHLPLIRTLLFLFLIIEKTHNMQLTFTSHNVISFKKNHYQREKGI
jgi:hypothetical protein